jgi:hypothetical protein
MRPRLHYFKNASLLFAILTLLSYGLLLGKTGFHWDDWGFAWAARFLGPGQFIPSFGGFRPFLGPIFFITTTLIPAVPLYWQIFALITRFLIGLSTFWALRSFWPERRNFALLASLLMLVYPGYSQHWVALTHINQELIPLIFYLLSLGVSAHAIRKHSVPLTLLALFLQFWGLFPTEYFLGLEGLRFLLICSMLNQQSWTSRLRQALVLWLPYLLLWLVNAGWLAYLYNSPAYISYRVDASFNTSPISWLAGLLEALLKAGLIAWGQFLVLAGSSPLAPSTLFAFGLVLLSFVIMLFYFFHLPSQAADPALAVSAMMMGVLGVMLGRVPSLAAGLPLTLQSLFDRFTISMALGASLLAAGLIEWIFGRHGRQKWIAASLVIALAVGQQFLNANIFRRDWSRQQEIYWQFAWRVPALEPGTLLLTGVIPDMPMETDLTFTAPMNWIYAPDYSGGNLPYALLYADARLGGGALRELKPHLDITLPFRTVSFQGSSDEALVFLIPEQGCLRILDPAFKDDEAYRKESKSLTEAIPLSDPSRIQLGSGPRVPPQPPFASEPAHTWCYFYEKAELARQVGEWQKIIELQERAALRDYQPQDAFEWLPFIEALVREGQLPQAISLSRSAAQDAPRLRKALCNVWKRSSTTPDSTTVSSQIQQEFGCTP